MRIELPGGGLRDEAAARCRAVLAASRLRWSEHREAFDVDELPGNTERQLAAGAAVCLAALTAVNLAILERVTLPALYDTKIQFRPEPGAGIPGVPERFDHALLILRRGWADCDDLTGYRVAELRHCGERATPRIIWPEGTRRYHAKVRRADQSEEDPSLVLRRKNR